jgi:hypothetical protein
MALLPLAVPLAMAGAGLVTKGYGMYEANKRQKEADKQLAELAKKPYDQYKVNPLVSRYTQMGLRDIQRPQGFTGAEAAQFQQRIAAGQEAARRNAISLGGSSVARAVGGALGSANLAAENQFAAQGAGLARSNRNLGFGRFMQGAGVAQGIDQMNTQQSLQRRMMLEQAYGAASRQAADQQRQFLQGMGSDLFGAGVGLAANEFAYSDNPFGMNKTAAPGATATPGLGAKKAFGAGKASSNIKMPNTTPPPIIDINTPRGNRIRPYAKWDYNYDYNNDYGNY